MSLDFPGLDLNFYPMIHFHGPEIELEPLYQLYQEITGNPADTQIINDYRPITDWYQKFISMNSPDVQLYGISLLELPLEFFNLMQTQDPEQFRENLAQLIEMDRGQTIEFGQFLEELENSHLVKILEGVIGSLTKKEIAQDLIALATYDSQKTDPKDYKRIIRKRSDQYMRYVETIFDLLDTMISQAPPLDNEIILFSPWKEPDSSELVTGSLLIDQIYRSEDQTDKSIIRVPAGTRLLPLSGQLKVFGGYLSDYFILPRVTSYVDTERSIPLTMTSYYEENEIMISELAATEDHQLKIYRIVGQPDLDNVRPLNSYKMRRPRQLKANDETHLRNLHDILCLYQPSVYTETPKLSLNGGYLGYIYLTQRFVTGEMLEGQKVTEENLCQYINRYLPSQPWLIDSRKYIVQDKDRYTLLRSYTKKGDEIVNAYLRSQTSVLDLLIKWLGKNYRRGRDTRNPYEILGRDLFKSLVIVTGRNQLTVLYDLKRIRDQEPEDIKEDASLDIYETLGFELTKAIQDLILRSPPLDKEIIVFRGVRGNPYGLRCQEGEKFTVEGMMSCSTRLEIGMAFGNYVYVIRLPEGSRALPLNMPALPFREDEILLPHGSQFVIDQCIITKEPSVVVRNVTVPNYEPIEYKSSIRFYFCHLEEQPIHDSY